MNGVGIFNEDHMPTPKLTNHWRSEVEHIKLAEIPVKLHQAPQKHHEKKPTPLKSPANKSKQSNIKQRIKQRLFESNHRQKQHETTNEEHCSNTLKPPRTKPCSCAPWKIRERRGLCTAGCGWSQVGLAQKVKPRA